ncbi:MAG: hypothetical protein VX874_01305 [Pseudomonadota bacterium]|nr:hypothetical protein [Pseudomonadota bacterium]
MSFTSEFFSNEDGAVTVDWVVLTGAVIGLGMAVMLSVSGGTTSLASNLSDHIGAIEVGGSLSGGAEGEGEEDLAEDEGEDEGGAEELADGEGTGEGTGEDTPWEAPASTDWNNMYAGNYWGYGSNNAGGDMNLARQLSLAKAAEDAPAGFNLANPLMSPGENGVVYTSNSGTHYSVNGHVSEIGPNGSYVDQWGGTRNVRAWSGDDWS